MMNSADQKIITRSDNNAGRVRFHTKANRKQRRC